MPTAAQQHTAAAAIPAELQARGFKPDSLRWWIDRWEDETLASEGASLRRTLPGSLRGTWQFEAVSLAGVLLLSVVYLGAPRSSPTDAPRRVLLWLGGLTLLPGALGWMLMPAAWPPLASLPGWAGAEAGPLLLSWRLHGRRAWPMANARAS